MSTEELRLKILGQLTPAPFRKRSYEFHARGPNFRVRNKKRIILSGRDSVAELVEHNSCCGSKCLSKIGKEDLIQERIKYLILIFIFMTVYYATLFNLF